MAKAIIAKPLCDHGQSTLSHVLPWRAHPRLETLCVGRCAIENGRCAIETHDMPSPGDMSQDPSYRPVRFDRPVRCALNELTAVIDSPQAAIDSPHLSIKCH
jgi:hypothetical protein